MPELRPYQIDALEKIQSAYAAGKNRILAALPTGAGKTVLFSELISQLPGNTLVLAHRDRLIQQAVEKISNVIPISQIGIVKAEQNRSYSRVVVASVQSLSRQKRLKTIPQFDTLIIDEAHRSCAKTYRNIIKHVCHERTLLLGVTATPSRSDGIGLDEIYTEIIQPITILELIEQGYLVPLRGQQIRINADFSRLHTKTNTDGINDYRQDEVIDLMAAANWHEKVSEGWLKYGADRRTIAFVPRVAMAYNLAEHLRKHGVAAAALDGSTSVHVQRSTVKAFERGDIQFLANCDLFVEGADIPSIECVVFARPTKSQIVYSQAIGRGTRPSPDTGKSDCLVLDMVGASNRFDLCTLGSMVGLRSLQDNESISDAVKREKKEDEEKAAEQLSLPEHLKGDVIGHEVDIIHGNRKTKGFIWEIYAEAKRALLRAAGRTFEICKRGDEYHYSDTSWMGKLQGTTQSYTEAREACENVARENLFGPEARWRTKPASEKQIALLTKLHIVFDENISAGEASNLIDQRFKQKAA